MTDQANPTNTEETKVEETKVEETKKKEITYIPNMEALEGFDREFLVTTNVGATKGAVEKFEIYWAVPQTDEEATERYNLSLKELIEIGVSQLTTRPNYQKVGFDEAGKLVEGGHDKMQALANAYKANIRKPSDAKANKQKADDYSAMMAKVLSGELTLDDIKERAAKMNETE